MQVLRYKDSGIDIRMQDSRRDPGFGRRLKNCQFTGSVDYKGIAVINGQPQYAFPVARSNVEYAVCKTAIEFIDVCSFRVVTGNHGECFKSSLLGTHPGTATT